MSDEKTPATGFKFEIGKQIDNALGEVIRGFLKRPAEEAGNLIADGIGILGDRVRRKREINIQLGIEEVRKKLEASCIDMEDITPPSEEDLHLLMSGISLSGDETTRGMWAGLFAKALDPESDVTAERPFISVLQSLSPMDAKIVDFLAFVIKTDEDLRRNAPNFSAVNMRNPTAEDRKEIDKIRLEVTTLRQQAVRTVEDRARDYGIDSLSGGNWAENLIRQGVIEKAPPRETSPQTLSIRAVDERSMRVVEDHINEEFERIRRAESYSKSPPNRVFQVGTFQPQIEAEVVLTPFGRHLAKACGLL